MAAAEQESGGLGAARATPGRVLLVDDNAELRRGLRRMLQAVGHEVVEASDGREATTLAAAEHFDAVLSDVLMPDMGGVELLRLIHERDPDLPVLLISGDPDLQSALKAVQYGALEYLTKPVRSDQVRASIARAIEVRHTRALAKVALNAQSGARVRAPMENLTGTLLAGRYRIGARLGSGGMGAVYEAVREDLAKMPVAIKVLHPSLATDIDVLRRFQREAHTVAALDHPNIVRIVDFHMLPDEPAFLVMERLHGLSLSDSLTLGQHFSLEEVAFIAVQTLSALEAAHGAGVIHRDLKPDNVFLTSVPGMPNLVKLLDFGVAKQTAHPYKEKLTQTGMVMGTPAYMAPEQARGAGVDVRSDLYSVGCVMFEALTGRAPFTADNYNAMIYEIQQGTPAPLEELRPDLDPAFVALVKRAMAREPEERFQTARAMADAVAVFTPPVPGSARRSSSERPLALAATVKPPSSR
jgi:CheY-like chemotaxis protein/tRNA A-37 threonylcarbamoyl transferase component Bud32